MTDKNKADQQASPQTSHVNNTSTEAQRARLLDWLNQCAVDTIFARDELNIMMPAARIKELREAGYPIKTQRITLTDAQGRTHRGVALYYMGREGAANE